MHPQSLAVLGLGAMGGSVAWQARRAGVSRVVGYSLSRHDGVGALRSGAIDDLADSAQSAVAGADLAVIATPPPAVRELLGVVGQAGGRCLVTDLTSIKVPVMRWADEAGLAGRFAGSHPFVGTHLEGWAGASPDRFRNAVVYVVSSGPGGEAAAREVMDFWQSVMEADPVRIEAQAHDTQLAWTSHLPQVAACALARAVGSRDTLRGATWGRGIRDSTRIAASPPAAWIDVLLLNRAPLLEALASLEHEARGLQEILAAGDRERLSAWLGRAAAIRRGVDPISTGDNAVVPSEGPR